MAAQSNWITRSQAAEVRTERGIVARPNLGLQLALFIFHPGLRKRAVASQLKIMDLIFRIVDKNRIFMDPKVSFQLVLICAHLQVWTTLGPGNLDLSMFKVFDKESDMAVVRASKSNIFILHMRKLGPERTMAWTQSSEQNVGLLSLSINGDRTALSITYLNCEVKNCAKNYLEIDYVVHKISD